LSETTDEKRRRSPKMMISIGIGVILATALIAVVSALTGGKVTPGDGGLPTSKLVGQHVKAFTLDGLNGGVVKSPWSDGRASVLVFFASYCGPCQGEMPKIAKYIRTHSPVPVEVVAVDAIDKRSAAQAMIKKDDVTFPVAFDPNGVVTTNIFGFEDVPESVFVSAKGVVKRVYYGAIPKDTLASGIKRLKDA
jgi:cytochrome c biogenesis protein CcmG/thiol:disulfide interchange protein DsbE